MKLSDITPGVRFYTLLLLCIGAWITQFIFIVRYAVNVPFWDEWEAINKGGFIVNQTFWQIFVQHNEHRIITTKILTLVLYYFDGWNLATHQTVNFVIYGILIGVLAYVIKKSIPEIPGWVLLSFILFTLTNVSRENHSWGFQSQFHFSLLFLFLSVLFLFDEKQGWGKVLGGTVFSVLTIYSFSSGLIGSVVILFGYSLFKLIRIRLEKEKKREVLQWAAVMLLIGGAIGLYFVGFIKQEAPLPYTFPYQKLFWAYLMNLLSGGIGYQAVHIVPGIIFFFFIVIPVIGEIKKHGFKISSGKWVIIISILAVLAALAAITMGRAEYGKGNSKTSRYTEITIMLVPLSAALWVSFLGEREKLRKYILIGFWIFCGFGLSRCWNFPKAYQQVYAARQEGLACIKDYYQNGGVANCPTIYPSPIADRLDFVKTVPVSFIKEINNPSSR